MTAVDIDEVTPWCLFERKGKTYQVKDMKDIEAILPELKPIPIDWHKLWRLGFDRHVTIDVSYKVYGRVTLCLKPTPLRGWQAYLEGKEEKFPVTYLHYIHQVQQLWFGLFQEHLWRPQPPPPTPKPAVPPPPKPLISIPLPDGRVAKVPSLRPYIAVRLKESPRPMERSVTKFDFYEEHKGRYLLKGRLTRDQITGYLMEEYKGWGYVHQLWENELHQPQ